MALTLLPGCGRDVQSRSPTSPGARHPLHGTPLRQVGWLRYEDGLGRIFQAVEHPRLTRLMRSYTGEERTEAYWLVDGQTVEDPDEALEALSTPPVLSAEELEVLDLVPDAWIDPAGLRAAVVADLPIERHAARVRVLGKLADKGMIEVESNQIRRSSAVGRA